MRSFCWLMDASSSDSDESEATLGQSLAGGIVLLFFEEDFLLLLSSASTAFLQLPMNLRQVADAPTGRKTRRKGCASQILLGVSSKPTSPDLNFPVR